MAASSTKSAATKQPYINSHESLSGIARFFADGFKKQAIDQGVKAAVPDVLKQVSGVENPIPRHGDMKPGETVNLKAVEKSPEKPKGEILGGLDYRREVVHGTERIHSRQMSELDQKLQQIMNELKRLVDSSQIISNEYMQLAVDQKPVASGTYHLNFFDFMLSVIRSARQKVEDSGAWLSVSKKKNGYQQKAQSLGTKFTLSNERTAATQTG